MRDNHQKRFDLSSNPLIIGIGLAVLFWIFEAFITAFVFRESSFVGAIFSTGDELWERCFVAGLLIAFAYYIQLLTGRRRRAEEVRYQRATVVESSKDAIIGVTLDGIVTTWNSGAQRLYGYSAEEMIGQFVSILAPPDRRHEVSESLEKLKQGRGVETDEAVRITRDGKRICVSVTMSPIKDSEGNVTGASTISRDVTKRKEAEEALRESEERFRGLSDATFEGIAISEAGKLLEVNNALAAMYGYEPSEIVGMSAMDLMAPESRELAFQNIDSGVEEPYEVVGLKKDGTTFDVEARGKPSIYKGRKVRITAIRDITERKKIERTLRQNEQRFRQLFEQSVDVLLVHDAEGRIVDCNEEAHRSLGYTREELLSLRISGIATNLFSEEKRRSRAEPTLWQRAMKGEPGRIAGVHRGEHRRKDGTVFPVEVYVGSVDYGGERLILASCRDITERKKAEEALRKSQERNRAVVETATDAILTMTADGLVHSFNPAAERIFGYTSEEVVGKPLRMLMPKRFRSPHEKSFRRYREGGEAHVVGKGPVELAGLRKGGEEFPLELSLGEMREEGDILFTGIIRDVTERKRAEKALQESEEQLRLALEAGSLGTWYFNLDSGEFVASPSTKALHGLSTESWLDNQGAFDAVHPEDREAVAEKVERAISERGSYEAEYRVVWPDDTIRWLSARGRVYSRDEDGSGGRLVGIVRDMTERRQAEEELREAEERFRGAFDNASVGMALNDLNGRFIQVNSALCGMLGRSEEELLASTFEDITYPDDVETSVEHVQQMLESEIEGYHLEKRYLHADGHPVWISLSVSLVRNSEGHSLYLVAQMQDITERKRAEEEVRKNNALVRLLRAVSAASNEATSVEEALQSSIEQVCAYAGWPVGHAYLRPLALGSPNEVASTNIWCLDNPEQFKALVQATDTESG